MFGTACIIGLGALGGSVAAALRMYATDTRIIGVSREQTLAEARAKKLIHEGYDYADIPAAVSGADLIVMCTPVAVILEQLPQVAAAAPDHALITDVGSTKRQIVETAAASLAGRKTRFLGGHPMAGSEQRGVQVSNPVMFRDRPWILVEGGDSDPALTDAFQRLVESFGARPVRLSAEDHDRLVAAISHLPQLVAVGLMDLAGTLAEDAPALRAITGRGFTDMTRIAGSPFDVWRDICATNRDNITAQIDQLIALLTDMRNQVGDDTLGRNFERAAEAKQKFDDHR